MSATITVTLWTSVLFLAIMLNLAMRPNVTKKIIASTAVFTAIGGLLIYGYGYASVESSTPLAVIQATIAVCKIFVGGNALDDIKAAPAFAYDWFRILYWLLHLTGPLSSTSAAISALGSRLLRKLRLWLNFREDVAVIYGLNGNTLEFGRKLTAQKKLFLVYVDRDPQSALSRSVDHMGCILRSDADALQGTARFIKSLGLQPGKRQLQVYALDPDIVADKQYARALLNAMQELGIDHRQTALTIFGSEDETDNSFQYRPAKNSQKERYGYGTVFSINEPEMVARMLVRTYPPCNKVDFDEKGKATGGFHGLIIGFGQVGQAVLRQLVMNGQFHGSSFHVAVFAPKYDQMMGRLQEECGSMLDQYDIQFFDQDGRSLRLFHYLSENAQKLRYVVICTGNDKINSEIAEQLRAFLYRRGGGSASIFLCSRQGIRYHTNEDQIIHHKIYTPEILCSDQIDEMAKQLNHSYCNCVGDIEENWEKCDYFSRMSNRASADFLAAMLRAAHVTPEEVTKHWKPQGELLENLAQTEHLRWCAFHYAMGFRAMSRTEFDDRAGRYRQGEVEADGSPLCIRKNLMDRTHACLIPWEDLDELSRRENSHTSGEVNYKEKDRESVRTLDEMLKSKEKRNVCTL